jgi:hypothetical protein
MYPLDTLQRWMLTVITHREGVAEGVASEAARALIDVAPEGIEGVVSRSRTLTGVERLEIYQHAYFARLLECLREEFPVLEHALGREAFDQFALGYLEDQPSRSYTLNDLGRSFPHYLAASRPSEYEEVDSGLADWAGFLVDLARLEWTYNEVFDGPGVEDKLTMLAEELARVPPETWPGVRLRPVPCLRLVQANYPVHRYYRSVRDEEDPSIPAKEETWLAITRRDFVVRRHELSRLQFALLEALTQDKPIIEAIQTAALAGPDVDSLEADLHGWFQQWTREGFFEAVELQALGSGNSGSPDPDEDG